MIDPSDRGSHHRRYDVSNELERLNIKYNIALVAFFNEKEDLSSYPDFVDQIKSYKGCEIVLHRLTMVSRGYVEEDILAGLQIFQRIGIKTNIFIPPAWKLPKY